MRYLNYIYDGTGHYNLPLVHPEDIITLSTKCVKISNMCKCNNLRNIYSHCNMYKKHNIEQLYNLKRIYIMDDNYINENNCFLEDLIKNKKMEFVHI